MTLSILIWVPAAVALAAALLPRRAVGWFTFAGSLAALGIANGCLLRRKRNPSA